MAVVGVAHEIHQQRSGTRRPDAGRIVRTFRVEVDDPLDDFFTVEVAPGIPRLYDPHPATPFFTVQQITAEEIQSPSDHWIVSVEYSTRTPAETDEEANPLSEPVEISFQTMRLTKAVSKDIYGRAILNSAGCPFDPPVEIQRSHWTARFTRNEPIFDWTVSTRYVDHVNSGTFLGATSGYIICREITADKKYKNNQEYWAVNYEFEYNPDGWQPSILNAGYEELISGNRTRITDGEGRDISQPWPLDTSGLAIDEDLVDTDSNYITPTVYSSVNFQSLGLPA